MPKKTKKGKAKPVRAYLYVKAKGGAVRYAGRAKSTAHYPKRRYSN